MRKVWTLITTIILILSFSMTAFAEDGNVIYSGNAGEFIFQPGSDESLTDLFPNFKDVMPGDTLTQNIKIKNNAKNRVKIHIRSLGAQELSKDFLSQLNLVVLQGDTPIFEAPADQKAQLTEWNLLGILAAGAEMDLTVGLEIPVTLDNTQKNLIGYIDWEFVVEEFEDPKDGVQTGDSKKVWPWVAAAGAAATMIVLVIVKRRKDDSDAE